MLITPDSSKKLAKVISKLYADAEFIILNKLAGDFDNVDIENLSLSDWERKKLKQFKKYKKEMQNVIDDLNLQVHTQTPKIVKSGYVNGASQVDINLRSLQQKIDTDSSKVDEGKVKALAEELTDKLTSTHPQILRRSDDIYRRVISEAVNAEVTGIQTRLQATQQALNKFADQGITSFIDKKGRNWSMEAYSEMATRTGLVRANLAGTLDRMNELEYDLVIVSEHPEECPLCRPWEYQILRTGNATVTSVDATDELPTVEETQSDEFNTATADEDLLIRQVNNTDTAKHMNIDNMTLSQFKDWAKDNLKGDIDHEVAYNHVRDFTHGYDNRIRKAQMGKKSKDDIIKRAETLENYIKAAPKFTDPIFRGIRVTPQQLLGIQESGEINMLGTSSWSSTQLTASSYASKVMQGKKSKSFDQQVPVLFKTVSKNCTSVRHFSRHFNEDEVVVSKDSRFRIVNTESISKIEHKGLTISTGSQSITMITLEEM